MRFVLMAAVAVFALGACDSGGTETEAKPVAAAPKPKAPPPPPPKPAGMPGLTEPYATDVEWVAACTAVPIDATVCGCVGAATTKTLGGPAYYAWVWEAYVQRNSIAQARSKKWMEDQAIDEAGRKAFTDAVGKCYVTQ